MRVVAVLNPCKHAFVIGTLSCPTHFDEPQQVRFLVDTGASLTSILSYDTLRLGIDCDRLELTDQCFYTASGIRRAYLLPEIELELNTNDDEAEQSTITLSLRSIPCFPPPETIDEHISPNDTYSVLGMDVLYLFKKWQFTDTTLILE